MGLYDKIQDSLKVAFIGSLADAVTSFTIWYRVIDTGTYTDATGEYAPSAKVYPATTVADVDYVNGTCRGVLTDENPEDEKTENNVQFNYKIQSLTVLDSELNSLVFDLDTNIYYVTIGSTDYQILSAPQDPAKATFILEIREVQE